MSLRPQLLVLGAMFAFSLMALFTRGAEASILGIAAWRAVFVAVGFGLWTVASSGGVAALRPDRSTLKLGALLGLCLAVASASFVGGYALTTVANTIFLHNLAPLAVFPLAWWAFRERPSATVLTGGAVAVVGVGLLSGVSLFQVSHFASSRFLVGDGLALLSAVGYAGVLVVTRKTRVEDTPILGTLFVAWSVAAVGLVAVALAAGQLQIPWRAVPWVVGLAVVCTNLPFFLLNLGMREVSAGRASVLSLSEVLFATLLGLAVYGEHLAPVGWLGGLLAAAGVLYAVSRSEGVALELAAVGESRWLRLGLWLAALNASAVAALLFGFEGGALLAWIALVALARLGGPALGLRAATPVAVLVALLALAGLLLRGGQATGSLAVVALALLLLVVDRGLAARDTDGAHTLHAALGALALAELAGLAAHPAQIWLSWAALGLVGLGGLAVLVGALRPLPDPLEGRLRPGLVGALLVGLFVFGGLRAVPAGHVLIVERLGFPLPTPAPPGLSVRLPPPLERGVLVDMGSLRHTPVLDGLSPVLVGDESLVSLTAAVTWQVADPHAFTYGAADPEGLLRALTRSAVVQVVGQQGQDAVLTTGRASVEQQVASLAQGAADQARLGLRVVGVHLGRVAVPAPVMASFLDVISADEDRQTRVHLADAHAATVLPKARGRALGLLADAEGRAAWIAAVAAGEAEELDQLSRGGDASPALTRERLSLESSERALSDVRLVIVAADVDLWTGEPPVGEAGEDP